MNQDILINSINQIETLVSNLIDKNQTNLVEISRLEKENSDLLNVVIQQQQLIENLQKSAAMMQQTNPEELFDRERLQAQLSQFLTEINQCLQIIAVLETEKDTNE